MSALQTFLSKYGPKALDLIKEHPAIAAGTGAAAIGGAGLVGAKMGSDATVHAIPHEILKRLGISEDMTDDMVSSVTDAGDYARKHPIAAAGIGASAARGVGPLGQDFMAKLREIIAADEAEQKGRR